MRRLAPASALFLAIVAALSTACVAGDEVDEDTGQAEGAQHAPCNAAVQLCGGPVENPKRRSANDPDAPEQCRFGDRESAVCPLALRQQLELDRGDACACNGRRGVAE